MQASGPTLPGIPRLRTTPRLKRTGLPAIHPRRPSSHQLLRERRAMDSNPQPVSRHLISRHGSHSRTLEKQRSFLPGVPCFDADSIGFLTSLLTDWLLATPVTACCANASQSPKNCLSWQFSSPAIAHYSTRSNALTAAPDCHPVPRRSATTARDGHFADETRQRLPYLFTSLAPQVLPLIKFGGFLPWNPTIKVPTTPSPSQTVLKSHRILLQRQYLAASTSTVLTVSRLSYPRANIEKKEPPHQNLWVNSGSGRRPRLWYKLISMAS